MARQIIIESLKEIAISQPIGDRSHYVEAVLEANVTSATNGQLIEVLYKEIISKASESNPGKVTRCT